MYKNFKIKLKSILYIKYKSIMSFDYITETNNTVNDIIKLEFNSNEKYYKSVLKLLNKIFDNESKTILSIKTHKAVITPQILKFYNKIVDKFDLNKPLFDIHNFDDEYIYSDNDIEYIVERICNNLLNKIDYKLTSYKYNNKKKHKIISI